jgi:hypothetical protein
MGHRIYKGGSAQYVKLGPNALQIEHIRNPLFSFNYIRVAHRSFLRKAFAGVGVEVTDVSFSTYRVDKGEINVRVVWR